MAAGCALAVYVALIAASNWLTAEYGLVAGWVTAGTFTAGLVLLARDTVREAAGVWASLICVGIGVALSAWLAGPLLALASGVAFAVSELADTAVYEPLRRRGRLRAAAVSQVPGAVLDSWLFLLIAGFPLWPAVASQTGVKLAVVWIPLALVGGARALLRYRVRPESA
jgi:uncharacterized PurR-regulated membrane protein YhhQ (DUF165 family)